MLEFVKNAFHRFMDLILWFNLIFFAIGGGFAGNLLASSNNETEYVIGFGIIGILAGLIINIVIGGFIATIINIEKNSEIIKNSLTNQNANSDDSFNFKMEKSLAIKAKERAKILNTI